MNRFKLAALLACTVLLGACLPLGGSRDALDVASLFSRVTAMPGEPARWQLSIEEPMAIDPLTSARIAVKPDDATYGVLRGTRWSDSATEMMQTVLVHAFEDSGRLVGVGATSAGVRGDFILLTELRDFQAEYRGDERSAHVSLSIKLVRATSNDVLAAQVFTQRVSIDGSGTPAVIAAFQRAIDELLPAIVEWTLRTGDANYNGALPRVPG